MMILTFLAAATAAAAPPPPVRVEPPLDRGEIRAALTERMGQRQLDLLIADIVEDAPKQPGTPADRLAYQAVRR